MALPTVAVLIQDMFDHVRDFVADAEVKEFQEAVSSDQLLVSRGAAVIRNASQAFIITYIAHIAYPEL